MGKTSEFHSAEPSSSLGGRTWKKKENKICVVTIVSGTIETKKSAIL